MKKSFVLYTDYTEKFKALSDAQFGKLIRGLCEYITTEERPDFDELVISMAFDVAKVDLDRNKQKYDEICEKRKEAGRRGGIAKATKGKQSLANVASASDAKQIKQTVANVADNDNDNENDNDINTKEKITKKKAPVFYQADEAVNKTFIDYVEMRKKIKKPMTDRAIELAVKKLDKLSEGNSSTAIEVLNQSILNCWQDLYPVKAEKRTGTGIDWSQV